GGKLDARPGHRKLPDKTASPETLIAMVRKERGTEPAAPISPDRFTAGFEKAYADEMAWRNARGGATPDEIRRVAADMDGEFSEDQIALAGRQIGEQARTSGITAAASADRSQE